MRNMRHVLPILACAVCITLLPFGSRAEDIAIPLAENSSTSAQQAPAAANAPAPAGVHAGPTTGDAQAIHPTEYAEVKVQPASASTASGKLVRPGLFNSVHTSQPVLALTFDDGPHGQLTPQLLDILRSQGVHATFFVLGSNVAAQPDIARRIVSEGHEIANHSWDHPSLPRVSAERLDREIRTTSDIIEKTTGHKVTMMRPTYGALNDRVRHSLIDDYGLDVILWSVDPLDWKRPGPGVVTRRLVSGAHPGAILLAHDIHPGTIAAMPDTIAQLKAKGYRFVTVSELLDMAEPAPPTPPAQPKAAKSPKAKKGR